MAIKKYTDWNGWWQGLRTNLFKCLGTTGVAWLGTAAASGANLGVHTLDWKQAGSVFTVHILLEIFSYLKDNQPKEVVETTDTQTINKP